MNLLRNVTLLLWALCLLALPSWSRAEDAAGMNLVPSGAMRTLGGYRPQILKLSTEKPAELKKALELASPMYGVIEFQQKPHIVVLDQPDGKDARLYVDANGNGDLTDDPPTTWTKRVGRMPNGTQVTQYSGEFKLPLQIGEKTAMVSLGAYCFDKNNPPSPVVKNALLYYRDYAYDGQIAIGGARYHAMLVDDNATGNFAGPGVRLMIDINGDHKFDFRSENFDAHKPFNIKGTTYELADLTSGGSFKLVKSDKVVAEIPPPPDLSVGKKVLAFTAKKTDGTTVNFPEDYKGKLVMLDFWATWCGPCMGEVPGLVTAYNKFHPQGLEILGISLDQPNSADKVKTVTADKGMTWPQVYDGQFWKAEIAVKYGIESIPAGFLVDGDTGEILANGGSLRGANLDHTLQSSIEKKMKPRKIAG